MFHGDLIANLIPQSFKGAFAELVGLSAFFLYL